MTSTLTLTKTEELKHECAVRGIKYVGVRGNVSGAICFVGEAPGADEDQAGVPFVGAAGRELDRMLGEANVDIRECWWTNPYKIRPPDNKLARLSERGIKLELFKEQFYEELNTYKPTFIVPLGTTALNMVCPNLAKGKAPIGKYRGSLLRSDKFTWDHWVLPAIHPAAIFRDWAERQIDVLCFAKLREESGYWKAHGSLQSLPARKLIADPAADDAIDYLTSVIASPPETIVSIDIENIGVYSGKHKAAQRTRLPYVIGFSTDPLVGISIGLSEYDVAKSTRIWRLINDVLSSKRQVGQNYYNHDIPWLRYIGFNIAVERCEDTLVRHHTLWPEMSHKLEFQTFQYTRTPFYKDEGKNWTVKNRKQMKEYNCKDVCVTLEIFYEQEKEFNARG
jgi:DNA polymerase